MAAPSLRIPRIILAILHPGAQVSSRGFNAVWGVEAGLHPWKAADFFPAAFRDEASARLGAGQYRKM